jgi:pilus assembly protein CpaB
MALESEQLKREPEKGSAETAALSRKLLLLSVAIGLAGAGLLLLYLNRFEKEVSGGARVQLLTVIKPVKSGALLTDDALSVSEVPRAYVEQRAVRASERSKVVGIRTDNALDPQDTLLWTDLAISSEDRDLSSLVQPGKRAITVRASEAGSDPAGNGLMRPGDYVDVIVTLRDELGSGAPAAVVLLQRVLVLAVGSKTQPQGFGDKGENERGYDEERELTLSLKVEEAQLLSLARERGTLSVALRGPSDSKVIEGIADMPVSSLYDKTARETVQRRRTDTHGPTPIRLSQGEP